MDVPERLARKGWHHCPDWDDKLIGPSMMEFEYCTCFEDNNEKERKRTKDAED